MKIDTTGPGRTYSTAEVAVMLCGDSMKEPERWLIRQITHGPKIEALKIGRKYRFTEEQLADAIRVLSRNADGRPPAETFEGAEPTSRLTPGSLRKRVAAEPTSRLTPLSLKRRAQPGD